MFWFYVFLSQSLSFQTSNGLDNLVPIGNYPEYQKYDINLPECGLRYVPIVHNISLNKKCTENNYSSKTYYDIEANNLIYEKERTEERVFFGTATAWGESPWTVLLVNELYPLKITNTYCTGSLITFKWILTAAHCGAGWVGITHHVVKVIGGSNLRAKGESHYMSKWIPHEQWVDPSNLSERREWQELIRPQYDIGLIKLAKPFTRHNNDGRHYSINTVCLPQRDPYIYAPGPATFFGYGAMEHWANTKLSPAKTHEFLLKGDVNLLSMNRDCSNLYYCTKFKTDDGGRPCPGDSGGPLVRYSNRFFTKAVQIGVLSGIMPVPAWYEFRVCAQDLITDAVWPSVPFHIDWILKTIKEN